MSEIYDKMKSKIKQVEAPQKEEVRTHADIIKASLAKKKEIIMNKLDIHATLNRIVSIIDKLDDRLDKIEQHLAVYNEQLAIHIKRTGKIEEELKPVVKHVEQVKGAAKLLGWLIASAIAIGGAIAAYIKG